MGRPRGFDEDTVLVAAASVFVEHGYAGTSIDDLVTVLNLHRGSLYKAFGSKRGLFVATLRHHIRTRFGGPDAATPADLDLILVAALERGRQDPEIAGLVRAAMYGADSPGSSADRVRADAAALALGDRLLGRLTTTKEI